MLASVHGPVQGAEARGDWHRTKDILVKGRCVRVSAQVSSTACDRGVASMSALCAWLMLLID